MKRVLKCLTSHSSRPQKARRLSFAVRHFEIMANESFEDLLKKIGTCGIARYVHRECKEKFLQSLPATGKVIEPARTKSWQPTELIGRYSDIDRCDFCGTEFKETDSKYLSFWVTTKEEIDQVHPKQSWWKFW